MHFGYEIHEGLVRRWISRRNKSLKEDESSRLGVLIYNKRAVFMAGLVIINNLSKGLSCSINIDLLIK